MQLLPWLVFAFGQAAIPLSGAADGISAMVRGTLMLHAVSPELAQTDILFTPGFANLFMRPLISKSMLNVQS